MHYLSLFSKVSISSTRKGTFGVAVAVLEEMIDCLISSEIILLRLASDMGCLPDYLVAWLNSSLSQNILARHGSGGVMGHLTQDVVKELSIPLPPLEVQMRIVEELNRRREEARRLRSEAEALWAAARGSFENALLGVEG